MNEIFDTLRDHLDREIRSRSEVLRLVEEEGRILQAGRHDELETTLGQVREALSALRPIEEQRGEILDRVSNMLGQPAATLTLTEVAASAPDPQSGELIARRDELRRILRDTMARNRQNQYLLKFASGLVADTLDLLTTAPATPRKTYDARGRTGEADRQGALFRAQV